MANEDRMVQDMMRGMAGVMGMAVMLPALAGLMRPPGNGVGAQQSPLSIEIIPGTLAQEAQQALGISPQEFSPAALTEWSVGNIARVRITNSTYKTNPATQEASYLPYTFLLAMFINVGGNTLNGVPSKGKLYLPAAQPSGVVVTQSAPYLAWFVNMPANQTQPVDILFDIAQNISGGATAIATLYTTDGINQVGLAAQAEFTVAPLPVTVGGGITF